MIAAGSVFLSGMDEKNQGQLASQLARWAALV